MNVQMVAFVVFLFAGFATSAQATIIVNAVEMGGNVVFTTEGGGSLNLAAWSDPGTSNQFSGVTPNTGAILIGDTPAVPVDLYNTAVNFSFPASFGTRSGGFSSSGTPDDVVFGFSGNGGFLIVPVGYQSGDPLSGSATYNGETFFTLGGMIPGSYEWSWGSGGTADTFTLNIVPEPSTGILTSLGLVGLAAARRRRS
jgi:hypothetical protein